MFLNSTYFIFYFKNWRADVLRKEKIWDRMLKINLGKRSPTGVISDWFRAGINLFLNVNSNIKSARYSHSKLKRKLVLSIRPLLFHLCSLLILAKIHIKNTNSKKWFICCIFNSSERKQAISAMSWLTCYFLYNKRYKPNMNMPILTISTKTSNNTIQGLDSRTNLNLRYHKNGDLAHASLNFVPNVRHFKFIK